MKNHYNAYNYHIMYVHNNIANPISMSNIKYNESMLVSYDEERNVHISITSAREVDNSKLTLVWDKTFLNINTLINI